jgi:hypothetical protein
MAKRTKTIQAMAAALAERKAQGRREREERGRCANAKAGKKRKAPAEPLVNEFAARHGDYARDGRPGRSPVMRNRGGSSVDRWEAKGLLSETQLAAIAHMQRLWRIAEAGQRLSMNWTQTIRGCSGDGNFAEIQARADIHRIRGGFPQAYWDVFENVVRFDEPAGIAGSRLANVSRSAVEAAKLVVCLIADTIYLRERLTY